MNNGVTQSPSPVSTAQSHKALHPSTFTLHPYLSTLPGADLIEKGLADRSQGVRSPEACLVEMASPRLAAAGFLPGICPETDSEHTLYRLLGQETPDPYPLYNSLRRRLTSFQRALDHAMRKKEEK